VEGIGETRDVALSDGELLSEFHTRLGKHANWKETSKGATIARGCAYPAGWMRSKTISWARTG
jgi:hypothetical protein